MDAAVIIQAVLLSLATAALYASVASGLTLEFGVTRIVNFAHGEFVMVGAFITYFLKVKYGLSPFIGMVVAGIAMGVLSAAIFYAFLSRVLKQDEHNQMLATLGLSILMLNIAAILWTPDPRSMQVNDLLPTISFGDVTIPGNSVLVAAVGLTMYLALIWFMKSSKYGVQLRLASDDPQLALHSGVNVDAMFALSFVIGGITAGISGGLVALVLYVHPMVGTDLVVRAFAIVALGGLGSIPGALVGAVVLSLAETLIATFVPNGGSWGYGVSFLILIIVLIVRPTGLFGRGMQA
jgi:branched-chain amino acid transport system permease protein